MGRESFDSEPDEKSIDYFIRNISDDKKGEIFYYRYREIYTSFNILWIMFNWLDLHVTISNVDYVHIIHIRKKKHTFLSLSRKYCKSIKFN